VTAIEIDDLRHSFARTEVLRIDHEVIDEAEYVAVVGPNGSGKTTLASLLAGTFEPTAGKIRIRGSKPSSLEASKLLGYVPDRPPLFDELTISEQHRYVARLICSTAHQEIRDDCVELLVLGECLDRVPYALSKGQRKKAALAIGLSLGFEIIVFDEPTDGLDTQSRLGFRDLVRGELERGVTVISMTHDEQEIDQAHRTIML
jgi:ABC-2 type transport system ATP-binding protein